MTYRDEPHASTDFLPYRDDPATSRDDEGERGIAAMPPHPQGFTSRKKRRKGLLASCVVATLAAGVAGVMVAYGGGKSDAGLRGTGPGDAGGCEDDPTFVIADSKGHTCLSFVAHVGRASLRETRCNQPTGFVEKGDELSVKHFCRNSCGLCGGVPLSQEATTEGEASQGSANTGESNLSIVDIKTYNGERTEQGANVTANESLSEDYNGGQTNEEEDMAVQDNASIGGSDNVPDNEPRNEGVDGGQVNEVEVVATLVNTVGAGSNIDADNESTSERVSKGQANEMEDEVTQVNTEEEQDDQGEVGVVQETREESLPAQTVPSNEHPLPIGADCEDDPTFVLADNKEHTCLSFVAHVGRATLREARCNQPTGIMGDADELLVQHFCKHSCGLCAGGPLQQGAKMEEEASQSSANTGESILNIVAIEASSEQQMEEGSNVIDNESLSEGDNEEQVKEAVDNSPPSEGVNGGVMVEKGNDGEGGAIGGDCEDDSTFVLINTKGHTCLTFIAHAGRATLRETRCNQPAGMMENGDVLLVKHFCMHACGLCGEVSSSQEAETGGETDQGGENAGEGYNEGQTDQEDGMATQGNSISEGSEIVADSGPLNEGVDEAQVNEVEKVATQVNISSAGSNIVADSEPLSKGVNEEQVFEVEDMVTDVNTSSEGSNIGDNPPPNESVGDSVLVEAGQDGQGEEVVGQLAPEETLPAQPMPSQEHPQPIGEDCEDDPTFVLADNKGHTCFTFVAHVGRAKLHETRCNQPTGITDDDEELLVKHFCRQSCGLCGEDPFPEEATSEGEASQSSAKAGGSNLNIVNIEASSEEPMQEVANAIESESLGDGYAGGQVNAEEYVATQENTSSERSDIVFNSKPLGEEVDEGQVNEVEEAATEVKTSSAAINIGADNKPLSEDVIVGQVSEMENVVTQINIGSEGSNIMDNPPPIGGATVEEERDGQREGDKGQLAPEETPSVQSMPSNKDPRPIGEDCDDDPAFVLPDNKGHTCLTFVALVGRATLREVRCNQPTGIMDNGDELLVKHFCVHSCGMCDSRLLSRKDQVNYPAKWLWKEDALTSSKEGHARRGR